jgi:hypothetical protein
MQRFMLATVAIALLFASACATNGSQTQTAQQRQACRTGDRHPWCMQMAQTKPLGATPYGLEPTEPTNPEMRDDYPPYPRNPALPLVSPGISGLNTGGIGGPISIGGGIGGFR